ncbi:hypothetical protein HXX01_05450, partial [Candidatus Nomurabacteria bacterium]|nr:hypothetical protein [Candidatus Nomurabacteria bacterium]
MKKGIIILGILIIQFCISESFAQTISIPMTFDNWEKSYCGNWEENSAGLRLYGTSYRVGNSIWCKDAYNLTNCSIYVKWRANSGSFSFPAIRIERSNSAGYFSTGWSYAGSALITNDTWYYTRMVVNTDQSLIAVTSTSDYDDNGGSVFYSKSEMVPSEYWPYFFLGKINILFDDGYSGSSEYMDIGEVKLNNAPIQTNNENAINITYDFEDNSIPNNCILNGAWSITNSGFNSNHSIYINTWGNPSFCINTTNAICVEYDVRDIQGSSNFPFKEVLFYSDNVSLRGTDRSSIGCWQHYKVLLPPGTQHTLRWEIPSDSYSTSLEAWIDNIKIAYESTGFFTSGSVSGKIFNDINNNGIFDLTDSPQSDGWTVNLSGPVNQSIIPNTDGTYVFNNLPEGDYIVSETVPENWTIDFP